MSALVPEDHSSFEYIITHIFCPLKLPNGNDYSDSNDDSLLASVFATTVHLYITRASPADSTLWHSILRFVANLSITVQFHSLDATQTNSQLRNMNLGDVLAFKIRAQNAAVVFRKQENVTIFESFELSPKAKDVMSTKGKLVCSYPGPAIQISNSVFNDKSFLVGLVNFLVHMDVDVLPNAAATTRKAQSTVLETRDTTHPRYITELLTGILRGVGSPAEVVRISKRVGDDVVWNNSELPWRRSSLWLLIRVVLQTTLDRTPVEQVAYKEFMLFFICHLGKERICKDLSNDVLQAITAKISRRLRKLGPSAPDWLSRIALETCTSLRSTLEERWAQVQATQRSSPPWVPSKLDLNRDIQLALLGSSDYIRNRLANHNTDSSSTSFIPQHSCRGVLDDFLSLDGTFFDVAYLAEPHITLYDVEHAIEEGIDGWVNQAKNNNKACVKLEVLANKYSSGALKSYGNNPELLSIMLLTVIELWVALDKIVIREIPMLAEYSPEVPVSLLESLLICKATSLDRLRLAHQYLSRRHLQSKTGWSVFSNTATSEAFAVRYYRGRLQLQQLKTRIEEAAQRDVQMKVDELKRANARHAELQRQADRIEHTCSASRNAHPDPSKRCTKCRTLKKQRKLKIDVHEWPLPAGQLQAEVVVFELECPVSFNMWRTATFHLLVDLCSPSLEPEHPYITLSTYGSLLPYFVKHSRSRISLCSDTKPFIVTHYRTKGIPTTQESVCVPNGLVFYGFDSHARIPVSTLASHIDIGRYCTYQLQGGQYQNLQKYVDSTSHTSNEVIANQANCHKDLSIHEFVAFGHMRSGCSLQWLSILRELRGQSLTFRRPEVHLLIAQAVSQVGPLADSGWVWHHELQQPSFCRALLGELEILLRNVEANWLEAATMDTISFLLRRLLVSHPDQAISTKAIKLLRTVRSKVFSWVVELSAKLMETPRDEEFRMVLRDIAAICRSTFDVEPTLIPCLLHSAGDIDIFLFSATLVHDNTPSKLSSIPAYSQLLLDRDRRLSLVLESFISSLIERSDEGIDSAITRVWNGYRPGSKWMPLQSFNSRWFSCTTSSTAEQCSQDVHLNLLDGSLLVDTRQLGRLPDEILCHPLYSLLFGERVLDVIPGDLPGMDYSTRGTVSNHQVYFSLKNGSDLVIWAKPVQITTDDSEIMELVPQQKLAGDLPVILIEGHVHWLNLSTSVIEVRALENMWEASLENWMIDCTPRQYRMRKGEEFLLDIRSPSWQMVSSLLKPLDSPTNLLVSVLDHDRPSMRLSVILPRYGLSFYVDEDGDLQSHNIRGMVYDENQCIGTLFGLVNRLVLRPKIKGGVNVAEVVPRSILIPEGDVSFCKNGHHVRIETDTRRQDLGRVTYQIYRVDTDLGRLETISLTNRLYCAYLHALTSGCSTDPLTGRLGTEEALSMLRSASCWSAMKISPRDAELLCLIASLCPSRSWYPEHLKCMQKVEWLDLPAHSQHHELFVVAKAIQVHLQRLFSFHDNQSSQLFETFPSRNDYLLERSAIRASYLFPSGFSGLLADARHSDVRYTARDMVEHHTAEHRAYTAATTVYHRTAKETVSKNILCMVEQWPGSISGNNLLSLQYDTSWLAPDLPSIWLKAYNLLRRSDNEKWFQLLFSLPAMVYASPELSDLVPVLVTFASHQEFRLEDPPDYDSYNVSDGYSPSRTTLRGYVSASAYSLEQSPESSEPARQNENSYEKRQRQSIYYQKRVDSDADATVNRLLGAWPCDTPPRSSLDCTLYDVESFTSKVQQSFSTCYRNLKLKEHLTRVQVILRSARVSPASPLSYTFSPSWDTPIRIPWMVTEAQLLSRTNLSLQVHDTLAREAEPAQEVADTPPSGPFQLYQLINIVKTNTTNLFQRRYVSALLASAERFETESALLSNDGQMKLPPLEAILAHYVRCRANYIESLHLLQRHLGPSTWSEQTLERSGQWPRMTPFTLLRFLASPITISTDWKQCLVGFALLALELQHARRLLRLHLDDRHEELRKELENQGCDGWNAETHPDWLLIQLQGNFFVRRVQAEVANEMISPRSGDNTAMQLNMGEGKSSVIVPIIVVNLADGDQLVRVVVPKALTAQMFQLLVDRLGGLTNRRIYFLPFSRSLKVDDQKAKALRDIMTECMKERGILVVQPEHVLSLRLVSIEKQLPGVKDALVGPPLLELQKWLHSRSRDILDESDEILHVRYQLVYTIGDQQHMEGFPERWTTTQQILSLVKKHASFIRGLYPLGVEYEHDDSGSFPRFRILHSDAGQELVTRIIGDICDDLLLNFRYSNLRSDIKDAIKSFILCKVVSREDVNLIKQYFKKSPFWGPLLLLRGLLATGILLFAFGERRWRVDYGLAPTRTMLAVPYRAKDVPAQRAEFGQPDVAILLTCLSYYYGGLTDGQLKTSFNILLQQDDPFADYDLWVQECPTVPENMRNLSGINIKSSEQWGHDVFPLFYRNKATIDFYLSRVVFPKEAKEFPSKLSCSGWDLAEKRERILTGFSGTNDGQYLLPLHITQRDPDHQRGTNAKVLSYLLQSENEYYMCMTHENGERQTTKEFLRILASQEPEIRVLLDVGAQMLELQNDQLAKVWLDIKTDASAAIYFNEDDELTVLSRDGHTELLLSSPFGQQLDQCIVYLDDAHTRGTDIKFPSGFRAAVTLGPKVTKDRLTQGCMRMRKLGHGHSIMFFAPLEIDLKIRSLANKDQMDEIDTIDILHWAIRETCDDIQQRALHWALQGTDYASRYSAWSDYCNDRLTPDELSEKWLQPEAKSLKELYGPRNGPNLLSTLTPNIRQRCDELGILTLRDASMDEEQEREVIHEAERERQVERPPKVSAATHSIHPDVVTFLKTGIVPAKSKAFRLAFKTLERTSAVMNEAHVWGSSVLVTNDFEKTVQATRDVDDYLRPVQWVVSGKRAHNDVLVVLSPHEANQWIAHIRSSNNVRLHLYIPRIVKSMKPCDDLFLYSIPAAPAEWIAPAHLVDRLNVFAGQLYLKDYDAYIRLCRLLCVYARDLEGKNVEVGHNGFIEPVDRPEHLQSTDSFQNSPLLSVRKLMGIRRKGMSFPLTHMGKILDGRVLSADDF